MITTMATANPTPMLLTPRSMRLCRMRLPAATLFRPTYSSGAIRPDGDGQPEATGPASKEKKKKKRPQSQATILVSLTRGLEKWHSPDGVAYISAIVDNHREHLPIKSSSFRRWLQREYYRRCKGVVNSQALQDAIGVLEGKAIFDGREYPVHLRLAESGGNIYIDLVDAMWQVVEITPNGWRVLTDSPVKFRRYKAMLFLPEPIVGGTVEKLHQQLNINANDWPLVAAWILAAFRPKGPFPVLNLSAEQGAGKTTAAPQVSCPDRPEHRADEVRAERAP